MSTAAPPPRTSWHRQALRRAAETLAPSSVLVTRVPSAGRRIALTFDDGPEPLTCAYLDELDRLGVRATFFVLGKACEERPTDVLEIVRRGHEVAGHGYSHKTFPQMSRAELEAELARTAALVPPAPRPMLRPPGGTTTARSLATCARAGYSTVLWSIDSHDCRTADADAVAARVAPSRVSPGDIVLLHEGQSWTLAALPRMVGELRSAGYELATVGELVGW